MRKPPIKTTASFIRQAVKIHGDLYDYSKTEYKGYSTKVLIICKIHGEFFQNPGNHIYRKSRCFKCGREATTEAKRNGAKIAREKKFKNIVQPEEHKIIPLSAGKSALVDNDDFDRLKDITWCFGPAYAYNPTIGVMHRFIMNCPSDMFIDHINHDTLDNRKSNLRICTMSENNRHIRPKNGGTSKYKGVHWCNRINKWISKISINGKTICIGRYENEIVAAKAYDKIAIELFKEFAILNF